MPVSASASINSPLILSGGASPEGTLILNGDVAWVVALSFRGHRHSRYRANRVVTITGAGAHIGESVTLENHGTINLLSRRAFFIYAPAAFTNKTDGIVNLDGNGAGFRAAAAHKSK